jgi:hypothetical protein
MPEDQALQHLHAILARPEFIADRSVPWWQQVFGPLLDLIWSLISQFLRTLLDATTGREGAYGVGVLLVCLALLGGVAVYLYRALRLSVVRDQQMREAGLAERRIRSDELWRSAADLAAAGQLEAAARQLYLSALYALDERALLHVETNLTNREHALRLRGLHSVLGSNFGDLVDRYDRVRYGHVPLGNAGYEELFRRVGAIRGTALREAPT